MAQHIMSTSPDTDLDSDAVVEQATPSTSGENETGNLMKITCTNQQYSKGSDRPKRELKASALEEKLLCSVVQW